jgi:DNA helicase-2/ATP-dependent DNA helicase PcrA
MEDGVFPSSMALNSIDDEAEEEERRLAYVGITRAKDDLTLTYCRTRMLRGEVHYNPASRFLTEIPEDLIDETQALSPFGESSFSTDPFGNNSFREDPFGTSAFGESPYRERTPGGSANTGTRSSRPRLKAVYRKPSTDESKKPFIAKMSGSGSGLSSLQKGMPAKPSKPDYREGDRVRHVKYGEGTVKAIEEGPKDYKVTVVFDDYGQKVMLAAFAKLVKC